MRTIVKNNLLFILMLILCMFIVGCETPADKKEYKEANYTLYGEPSFEKQITLDEVKQALKEATNYLATVKSYSYDQTLYGVSESEYTLQGTTKIDVTGESPKASIELTGSGEFAFYITDGKAYLNYDGYKTYYEVETDLSNVIEATESSIGAFSAFDEENITTDNLVFAGEDKDGATVVKYNISTSAFAVIVIFEGKIMKVMHLSDEGVEYIAKYNYSQVTIEFPSDLNEYVAK